MNWIQTMPARILHLTDKFKVSKGYEPAFGRILGKSGIYRNQVIVADIYNLVPKALKRYGQEKSWKADNEKLPEIRAAMMNRVNATRPDVIAVSCPACLGVLMNGDMRSASIEKARGGVYEFEGIPVVVVYPITAIHRQIDERIIENDDGDQDKQEPYRVKHGATTLQWDWQKVGRIASGRVRKTPKFQYSICRTLNDCFAAREFLSQCILISEDIETGYHPPTITCVGFTGLHKSGRVHSYVIPFVDESKEGSVYWPSVDDQAVAWSVVRDINELPILKTMQNGNYDSSYFIRDGAPPTDYLLDSQYMWWSLYPELPKRLDYISSILLDDYQYWKDDIKGDKESTAVGSPEGYWRYNALDCHYTLFNTLFLLRIMSTNPQMQWNYVDAMMRLFSGMRMSMRGLRVDFDRMAKHRRDLETEMELKTRRLRWMLDEPEFNINSSDHKKALMYEVFGLRERNAKGQFVDPNKSKRGKNAVSAGKIPMRMAKSEHPLFKYILDTLEDALEPRVQLSNVFGHTDESKPTGRRGGMFIPTGRVRTTLNPVGTEMTRFSSKKSNFWDGGNLQNIRGSYKDFIVADENHIFIDVDFSQSDDVFIGYESQDVEKIRVIESGLDGHSVHGELFFGVPYDEIVAGKKAGDPRIIHPIKGIRQNSKRIVHGTNFQMAAFTLYVTMGREAVVAAAETLGYHDAAFWPEQKLVHLCGILMGKYKKKYKRLNKNEWYGEITGLLKREGKLTNAFGFTRIFLGDPTDPGTQREATSFYGQSNTGGNMNRVAAEIDWGYIPERFRDGLNPDRNAKPLKMDYDSHGFAFMLQVHDSYLAQLNLNHPRWREAANNLLNVMRRPVIIHGREVRIKTEADIGIRWGKSMLPWESDNPRDIEPIVAKLKQMERN